ncbi:MAG: hypothetical protein AB7F99_00700 [Vicinamibacterales bacterium]
MSDDAKKSGLPAMVTSGSALFPQMPTPVASGTGWFARRALEREIEALGLARDRQRIIRELADAYGATAESMHRTAQSVALLQDIDQIRAEARAAAAHERSVARLKRANELEAIEHATAERAEQHRARLLDLQRHSHNAELGLDVLRAARELTMRVAAMRKEADVADVEQTLGFLRRQSDASGSSQSPAEMLSTLAAAAGEERDRHFAAGNVDAARAAADRYALIQQLIAALQPPPSS